MIGVGRVGSSIGSRVRESFHESGRWVVRWLKVVMHMVEQEDRYDKSARLTLAVRSRVRRQELRPYAFALGTAQPPPADLSWAEDLRVRDVVRTVLTRSSRPIGNVNLEYGTSLDLADPVEVKTDFSSRAEFSYPLDEGLWLPGGSRLGTASLSVLSRGTARPFDLAIVGSGDVSEQWDVRGCCCHRLLSLGPLGGVPGGRTAHVPELVRGGAQGDDELLRVREAAVASAVAWELEVPAGRGGRPGGDDLQARVAGCDEQVAVVE
jgi:hypothetical protein